MATKKPLHRAAFLDQDGVINHEVDHLHRLRDLKLFRTAGKAIRMLNDAGFDVVVITNQAAIAKGIGTLKELKDIHAEIRRRIARHGAKIDAIYFCPHHPKGTVKRYAVQCKCRKPEPGMIYQAAKDLGIDLKKSFMVGDKTVDVLAGRKASLTTILVKTGYGGRDRLHNVKAHKTVRDLEAAAKFISQHASKR